ncbi:hypothetical protein KEM55_008150, partial [Ascosphaera atra]
MTRRLQDLEANLQNNQCNHEQQPKNPNNQQNDSELTNVVNRMNKLQAEIDLLRKTARRSREEAELDEGDAEDQTQPPPTRDRFDHSAPEDDPHSLGLPRDVTASVFLAVNDTSHPAYGMTPKQVADRRHRHRPIGDAPRTSLNTEHNSAAKFDAWSYQLETKFTRDWPLYLTDAEKINYALGFLEDDLFSSMQCWHITNSAIESHTYESFLIEGRHLIGYKLQTTDAHRELDQAYQKKNETVTAYHARLVPLWIRANSPEKERVWKSRGSLLPDISSQLLRGSFPSTREVLEAAREIEENKKNIEFEAQCFKPSAPTYNSKDSTCPYSNSSSSRPRGLQETPDQVFSAHDRSQNARYQPTATKPAGWSGPWFDPVNNPPRLTQASCRTLYAQGRCWRCRGSGHVSQHSMCPQQRSNRPFSAAANQNRSNRSFNKSS